MRNDAMNELEVLIGEWKLTMSNASFLENPEGTEEGTGRFEWVERRS